MINVFTAFSGYDSQCLALRRLEIPFDLVGWSEIDKSAIIAHNALFPEYQERNYGDISKIDWEKVPDIDLFTYSSPCQDFSSAGKMRGGEKGSGTRSSLLWECERAIRAKMPKMLVLENVENLVSEKFIILFSRWEQLLASLGYMNQWKVLNAQHYGIPQSRSRVFLVSYLDEEKYFSFPNERELRFTKDQVLESAIEGKYFLSQKCIERMKRNGAEFIPKHGGRMIFKTICSQLSKRTTFDNYVIDDEGIRMLTERECFRLMGLNDDEIDTIKSTGIPSTKLYHLAGNSIVVDVLEALFKNLIIGCEKPQHLLF